MEEEEGKRGNFFDQPQSLELQGMFLLLSSPSFNEVLPQT